VAGVPAPLRRLPTPAGLNGCLATLGGAGRPLVVDLAQYDGGPAAVIVLPAKQPGQLDVAVVGPECGVVGSDTKLRRSVRSGS
jgi:hypothetical protein